jgi:2-oxoglutarate ferredoxin oxidoreductase subunit alpha
MRRLPLTGNEAIAEAALAASCNFYAGYPITPSSEIMHYMARELPRRGGVFIPAEDELAAINMVIGASLAGAKAMTATSGPGFSLMQEGIGYAVMVEAPIVVVDVMRAGPATGRPLSQHRGASCRPGGVGTGTSTRWSWRPGGPRRPTSSRSRRSI